MNPYLTVTLTFGDRRYSATLDQDRLGALGDAEFARQAAEMVERTIVTHLGALPMLEEETPV